MLKTIDEILDRIVAGYDPEGIILFGSRASGAGEPSSDIDVLILKKTRERPVERRIVVEKLLADRDAPLDILVYTPDEMRYLYSIGSPFIEEVVETGRVIYMRKATEDWLKDAGEELSSAELLLEHKKYKTACYHNQQCVEKGLKAAILEKGAKPPKTRDIMDLLNEAKKLGLPIELPLDDAVFLNSVYKGRYPAEEGLLPHGSPDRNEAKRAVEAGRAFMKSVKAILKSK